MAQTAGQDPRDVRVVDIGAGTGEMADTLHACGFRLIDGVDPAQKLLDLAAAKGKYTNLVCSFVTREPTAGIEADAYDAAVCCGTISPGHCPIDSLHEMARIVRPGGCITLTLRDETYKVRP